MTVHTIEKLFLPSVAQNGKRFEEAAPGAYQIGDTITWTVHLNDEGRPVDVNARRHRRRGKKPAVEIRTYTLAVDGAGKEFMNEDGEMRQRFYGEVAFTSESL